MTAEISRIKAEQVAFTDQVDRTMVRSPVDGIVQKLFVNTVGGVIKPGADLIEIVPTDERLSLEIKIPSPIKFPSACFRGFSIFLIDCFEIILLDFPK